MFRGTFVEWTLGLLIIILVLILTAHAVYAKPQPQGEPPMVLPPEIVISTINNVEILVKWHNRLEPSMNDPEVFQFEVSEGTLIIELNRGNFYQEDVMTVIDVPQGYVVLGPMAYALEEHLTYEFKVVPYEGF